MSKSGIEFNIEDYFHKNPIELVEADDSEWLHFCWCFYRNIHWPKDPVKHCWNWRQKLNHGYGRFAYKGQRWMAHRISWEIYHNQLIPEGKVIRHMCHRPQCVNPHHLKIGTQLENMRDMLEAGRQGFVRKLTPSDIHTIRTSKKKQIELAREFGVSATTIHCILKKKKYS